MVRIILLSYLILNIFSCQKEHTSADFKGVWIDKTLLELKNNNVLFSADTSVRFPLIMIEKNQADSVLFYYHNAKKNVYSAEHAYDSYFVHFDKTNEYFLVYDYTNNEMVFSNFKCCDFHRFQKIKTDLTREDVLSPNFDIDLFIQTVE